MDLATLKQIAGNRSGVPYDTYLPHLNQAVKDANCTTVLRVAHFLGQVLHESGGFVYLREIHDGSNYEGRTDLNNIYPGDGKRFRGRGVIQLTGRYNYTKFSQWAHNKGMVSSPTYFVDNPTELEQPQWAFRVASYYWTVARDINPLADRDDLTAVTKAVNGGTRGLEDRRTYYQRAKAEGTKILPSTTGKETPVATYYDEDWSTRFWEHGTHDKSAVILHTTENPAGTPAANVANYQLTSQSGSYHMLVDTTGHRLRENTDDQKVWACGNHGNNIGLNLSFVAQAAWTRAQWLAQEKMLRAGATVVAYWCDKHNIPKKSITPAQLKAGTRGISDHNGARLAWGVTTHTDVGAGFPWDVFIRYVNEVGKATAPATTPSEEDDMTDEDRALLRQIRDNTADCRAMLQTLCAQDMGDPSITGPYGGWPHEQIMKTVREKIAAGKDLTRTEQLHALADKAGIYKEK